MAVFRYKITNVKFKNDSELEIYYQYNDDNNIVNAFLNFDLSIIKLKVLKYKENKYIAISYLDGFLLDYFLYILIVTDVDDFNLNKLLLQITI